MRWVRPLAFGNHRTAVSRWIVCATVALAAALVLVAGAALADGGYEITWFAVGGGGGQSAGAGYSLAGTVGQPEAGELSGGDYSLVGGFWPGAQPLRYRYLPVIMR